MFYWFNIVIRGSSFEPAGDVTSVWIPFARCVINGGNMYVCHWDNKPPLFHFLNVSFFASDFYFFFFFVTTGLANGIAALLIWRLCRRRELEVVGIVSAILFVGLIASLSWRVNPRNYAIVFLLLALLSTGPIRAGVSIAAAGLFTQFAVFLIPAVLWFRLDPYDIRYEWLAKFIVAGLVTVGFVFAIVAFLWSPESAMNGFRYSFFSGGEYVAGYNERGLSLYGDPVAWVYKLYRLLNGSNVLWLALGGCCGMYFTLRHGWFDSKFGSTIVLSTILAGLPLTIRTAPVYLVLLAPFLTILFVLGIGSFFDYESIWT
jgi:MFS family permease